MTTKSIPFDVFVGDSFSDLRLSVDAISCAVSMIPENGIDDSRLSCMFIVLASDLEVNLQKHFLALASSNAKSGDPQGSDLVIDDTL